MNYANMIEEKHLKKGFIIATLISTVIGTFTTSIGLYERVRDRHRQHKTDHGQDKKIKELERRADDADKARRQAEKDKHEHAMAQFNHNNNNNNNNNTNFHGYPPYQYAPYGRPQNDLRDALAASGPMIRGEYDRDYERLGSRFAVGDAIAENELQAQIIDLQASVIRLLQDALETGTLPDPAVLYAAAGRARNGSIQALRDQYQRMMVAAPVQRAIEGVRGGGGEGGRRGLRSASVASSARRGAGDDYAARRRSGRDWAALDRERDRDWDGDRDRDWDSDRDRDRGRRSQSQFGARRAATFPLEAPRPPLFCRYAIELQQDWRRPLNGGDGDGAGPSRRNSRRDDDDGDNTTSTSDDGDLICPACMGQFAIEHDRSWKMHKPVVVGERVEEIVNRDSKKSGSVGGSGDNNNSNIDLDDDTPGKLVTSRRRNIIELVQDRQFVLSNRFIVKCHRPAMYETADDYAGSGVLLPPTFACCLCDRFDTVGDGKVAVCTTMTRLVNHVCEKHTVGELLSDPDIRELRTRH
ncbi:uncharacterized protein SPSK_10769 [Sporothrix schenckii 1099-18]|uniref:Uncharacterized protein n=1 Tax=Sporothrix schenckii 1099-18 TaxID=1397361 RepID=A0A0F2MGH5_SPOSC|nr:uncharacterized protein SPSK_10769 [Sporothrix schenckii 1099-18]KJR88169.1 hypothetical protein SPSK_10769 [Sporothrix schenckii 1099-18]